MTKEQRKEYWKEIIHYPYRMDDWFFWLLAVVIGLEFFAIVYLFIVSL